MSKGNERHPERRGQIEAKNLRHATSRASLRRRCGNPGPNGGAVRQTVPEESQNSNRDKVELDLEGFETQGDVAVIRKGRTGDHPIDRGWRHLDLGQPVDEIIDELRWARPKPK